MCKHILSTLALFAASAAAADFTINAAQVWTDTNLDVAAGETLRITATGSLEYAGAKSPASPKGLSRGFRDLVKTLPVNAAGRGALVARVGDAVPFAVGEQWEGKMPIAGRLFLGINQGSGETATGSFAVKVDRVAAAPAPVDVSKLDLPKLSQAQLDSVAPRVQDAAGTPGDRVNFMIIGSEKRMVAALQQAGWVIVDKNAKNAALAAGLATLMKKSYVTMPMSELQLFGRSQDYGWAQGDPLKVVAARHHFRVWKAPFAAGGVPVWAGAGTHDIGFDKDQRTGGVTHKIDPDTDKERDHIGKTLQNTGLVARLDYMTAKETVKNAKTAHGEEFHSDGRTLIITLLPDSVER